MTSDQYFSDGTFSSVNGLFQQLYSVHGSFYGEVFPFVYMLLPNKTQITYRAAMEALKEAEVIKLLIVMLVLHYFIF